MQKLFRYVLKRYKMMPVPVKASFWFTVCNVINKGIALLSTPVLTRILSQEQYGSFSVYQSWVSIITIFASLNLFQNAFTKGMVKFDNDKKGLTSSLLALSTIITLLFSAIFLIFSSFWIKVFKMSCTLISAMFIEILFMSAFEFWATSQKFDYKYKLLVLLSIFMSVSSLSIGIIAILNTEYKTEARIFADVFSKTLIGFVLFILIMLRGKKLFVKEYWKYALVYNIPLIPHFLSHFILNQSDRLMISYMSGNGQAAIYSVAYSVSMMMFLVTNAINNSFTPYTYKNIKLGRTDLVSKNSKPLFILVCVLCTLTMVFGPEVINIFAGEKYMDAIWIIPPVATSVYFIFIYSLFVNIEYYFKNTTGISIVSVFCAFLNIILNYIFINKYGYFAAGYTTLISYITLAIMHYILYMKIIKTDYNKNASIYNIKIIFWGSVFIICTMFLMLVSYRYSIIRILLLLSGIVFLFIKRKLIVKIFKSKV